MFVAGRREILRDVILSEAKDLCIYFQAIRGCFASLGMTNEHFFNNLLDDGCRLRIKRGRAAG
ncbi:MAG TPA: hypothetical protein VNM47_08870 [Terriglobia bacterium]|nr:hypothetical protein [Terriglobia bacterium]